jgi:hypothetical protein
VRHGGVEVAGADCLGDPPRVEVGHEFYEAELWALG